MTRDSADYLVDRYSERKEIAPTPIACLTPVTCKC
jgi:hypothetical protein